MSSLTELSVEGKIGGKKIRLQIELGGKAWLNATDEEGQSGVFQPTEKMAVGKFRWHINEFSDDEDEDHDLKPIEQKVTLTKASTAELLEAMDEWGAAGAYDIVEALKDVE